MHSAYFGNGRIISIEEYNTKIFDELLNGILIFHSHFSEDYPHNIYTTYDHMISML